MFTISSWPFGNKALREWVNSFFGCFFYIDRSRIDVLFIKLYLDYDMKADFFPQFVENAGDCVKMVKMVLALQNEEAV